MLSTRPRTRDAVSVLSRHSGSMILMAAPVSDRVDRQGADRRQHVVAQRVVPLLAMLRVAPGRFMRGDVHIRDLGERHCTS
jgi:hypothetical protein